MPSYPTTCGFPIPYNGGFSLSPKKALTSVLTESKLTRSRSLITNNVYVVGCTFTFTKKSERDTFRQWFEYDLNYGNLWFNANWFTELGFVSGDWVFRFVNPISIDLTGYKDSFKATILVGPKNMNTVKLGVLVEQGIGGQYINQSYPFGFELFQAENIIQNRAYSFMGINYSYAYDYNRSNATILNSDSTQPSIVSTLQNIRSFCVLSETRIAYVCERELVSFSGIYNTAIVIHDYIEGAWVAVSSNELYTQTYISEYDVCALSSTEIAIIRKQTTSPTSTIYLRKATLSGGVWTTTATELTITLPSISYFIPSITALSNSRVVITMGGDNTTNVKIRMYDFSSGWTQFGTDCDTGIKVQEWFVGNQRHILVARSATEITINGGWDIAIASKGLFDYTLVGTVFVFTARTDIAFARIALVDADTLFTIGWDGFSIIIYPLKRIAGVWTFVSLPSNIIKSKNLVPITGVNMELNTRGLPYFMWNV